MAVCTTYVLVWRLVIKQYGPCPQLLALSTNYDYMHNEASFIVHKALKLTGLSPFNKP